MYPHQGGMIRIERAHHQHQVLILVDFVLEGQGTKGPDTQG
jgi:hypothetical protein